MKLGAFSSKFRVKKWTILDFVACHRMLGDYNEMF